MKTFIALALLISTNASFAADDFGPPIKCPKQGCAVGYALLNYTVSKIKVQKDRAVVEFAPTTASNLSFAVVANLKLPEDQSLLMTLAQQGSNAIAEVSTAGKPNEGFDNQRVTEITVQK